MELTQINSNQLQSANISLLNSSKIDVAPKNDLAVKLNHIDKVETFHKVQSPFISNLSNSIETISNLQSTQQKIQAQLEVVSTLETTVRSQPTQNALDSVQPQVQNTMATYNNNAKSLSNNLDRIMEEKQSDESRTYFDGILGAKPLSSEEILEAVNEQREQLEQVNKVINDQIIQAMDKSSEVIQNEKSTHMNSKTQEIDFRIESENFNKEAIKRFEGSPVDSQANANTNASVDLLAS
jgi:hypothetical protein